MASHTLGSMQSMNPFDNNVPRLTASERIQNKKSKAIYDAAKMKFQSTGACGNKNLRFYKEGTVRSVSSYETQRDLAKGNALCEDCDGQGMLCGPVVTPNMFGKITMGNNMFSERWGGGGFVYNYTTLIMEQTPADVVITSDVSGTWDPSAATITDPSKDTLPTYGYINNLIKVPRNLDGDGIVIDPSNTLFSEDACDPFRYMKHGHLKTRAVIRGLLRRTDGVGGPSFWIKDCSYNDLIGNFATLDPTGVFGTFPGVIVNICCTEFLVDQILTGADEGRIFEVHLELFKWEQTASGPFVGPGSISLPAEPVSGSYATNFTYDNVVGPGSNITWRLAVYSTSAPDPVSKLAANMFSQTSEFIHIGQGDCAVGVNLSTKNKTKQSYMHCLEDGTKKINFS